ncbi:PD-(D/E)XK motif protein [Mesorhizobium sp.]|uniref:PD-(D/E)XK motif protein n=1 Tax=Mesorhizobium sp. TaxID=1871066 RepID=UPI00257D2A3B|nr:PD-(D/E)XK motif protein [Mesorhizobium sp.]
MSANSSPASVAGQWTVLRTDSRNTGGLEIPSMPLGVGTATGPIRLAVGPNGEARLLLPLAKQERPSGVEAAGALALTVSTFMHAGRAHRFLDLTCLSLELEPVFGEVVDEIVFRVSRGIGCLEAARTTLGDFRNLLDASPPDRIDRSRVAGLVGELVVLNRLLDLSPSAWRAWRGPAGDRHDFRAAETSLEVKASLRASSVSVTINGLEQLAAPSGGTLHLAHFTLEPVSGGLLTIAALGARAMAKADDPAGLRDLFMGIGCSNVTADAWNQDAFRIESESHYRVEADFPRIVSSAFKGDKPPPGVDEVTYRIDLAFASSYKCLAEEIEALLRTLARS